MWKLVLAIAAAFAARPEAPRHGAAPAVARDGTAPAAGLAPAPLDKAPNTAPDPGAPPTVDPQKPRKAWEW